MATLNTCYFLFIYLGAKEQRGRDIQYIEIDGEKGLQATYTWLDVSTFTQWKQEKTRQKKQKKNINIKVIIIYKPIILSKSCYAEHTRVWVCVYL